MNEIKFKLKYIDTFKINRLTVKQKMNTNVLTL